MSQAPIRKVIILAAGLGTRFLPMTKAIPKAMLPILDKPVIQYLAEEAIACGITDVIIVAGRGKQAIENHFEHSYELEHELKARGKLDLLESVQAIEKQAKFHYVRQDEALGDGHALLCAKELVEDEPFAVLFGDDIIDGPQPALKQLLSLYKETGTPIICTERVPGDDISKYGVIDPESIDGRRVKVKGLVEKPAPSDAPSDLGVIGKYICSAEVMDYLQQAQASHKDGEIRLIDSFIGMLKDGKDLYALEVEGTRYDTGNRLGLLQANIAFGKKDPSIKDKI
jgi:UTP--glucose-1-phosphate uridylyltransferase